MSAVPVTPAAASAGDMLRAALSPLVTASATPVATAIPVPAPAETTAPPTDSQPAASPAPAPLDPSAEPAPAASAQMTLDDAMAALAAETSQPVPKIKEAWTAYGAMQDLAKAEADGGIGHVPSAADIRDYYLTAADHHAMLSDLRSGKVDAFLAYAEGMSPGVTDAFRSRLTQKTEADVATEYGNAKERLLMELDAAIAAEPPEIRETWMPVLKGVHLFVRKTHLDGAAVKPLQAPGESPEAAKLRQERDALQGKISEGQQKAVRDAYFATLGASIRSQVDEMLKPWRDASGKPLIAEMAYGAFHKGAFEKIVSGLRGNSLLTQRVDNELARAAALAATNPEEARGIAERAAKLMDRAATSVAMRVRSELAAPAAKPPAPIAMPHPGAAAAPSASAPARPAMPQYDKTKSREENVSAMLGAAFGRLKTG